VRKSGCVARNARAAGISGSISLATTAFFSVVLSAVLSFGSAAASPVLLSSAASKTSTWADWPGAKPSGFDTVAPAGAEGTAALSADVVCGVPSGFATVAPFEVPSGLATVAPCGTLNAEVAAGVAAVAAIVDDAPSGFATVAPCGAFVGGWALAPDAEEGNPNGLATVATGAAEGGAFEGATVADRTFAVTLAEPVELGVEPEDAGDEAEETSVDAATTGALALAPALELGAEAEPPGLVEELTTLVVAGFALGLAAVVGAMLTAIEAGGLPFAAVLAGEAAGLAETSAGLVCTTIAGEDVLAVGATLLGVAAAVCMAVTVPAPGVPMPGNTVPCCRLPSFG
jgi:hypothetical protein